MTTPLGFELPDDNLPIADFAKALRTQSTTADTVITTMKTGPAGPPGIPGTGAVPADNAVAGYVAGPAAATRAALGTWLDTALGKYSSQLMDPLRTQLQARTRPMPQGKCFIARDDVYRYRLGYQLDPLRWMVYYLRNSPNAPGGTEARQLVQLDHFAGMLAVTYTAWNAAGWTWTGGSWADSPLTGRRATVKGDYARFNLPAGSRAAVIQHTAHSTNGIAEVRLQDDLGNMHTPSEILSGGAMLAAGMITQADIDAGNISNSAYYVNMHSYTSQTKDVVISTNLDPQRIYTLTVLATGVQLAGTMAMNMVPNAVAAADVTGWAATRTTLSRGTGGTAPAASTYFIGTTTEAQTGGFQIRSDVSPLLPVTAGLDYTFSAYLSTFGAVTNPNAGIRMYFMDAGGLQVGATVVSANVAGAAWTRVSVSGVAPAGAVTATLRVGLTGANALGDKYYWTGAMLDQSATLRTYRTGMPTPYVTIAGAGREHAVPATGTTWVLDEELGAAGPGSSDPSAWEYALAVGIGGTDAFIGQQHGYERPVAFTVSAEGKALTPPVGTLYTSGSITIERLSDLYHPGTVDKVGTGRVVYSISAAGGLHVDRKVTWLKAGEYYGGLYMVMWPTILERVSFVGDPNAYTADKNLDKDPLGQLGKGPNAICYAWPKVGNYVAVCEASIEAFRSFQWAATARSYYEDRSAELKKLYITPLGEGAGRRAFAAGDVLHASSTYSAGRVSNPETTFKK